MLLSTKGLPVTVLNTDCMNHMANLPAGFYDLAIVDPPTGQKEDRKHATRPARVKQRNGNYLRIKKPHAVTDWDSSQPDQFFFDELLRVSKYQIIMCENRLNFDQKKDSSGRIVWNLLRDNDFSSCQIMWTNLFSKVEYFEYLWNGMQQGTTINSRVQIGNKSKNEQRIHPSQKPVIVYRYLLRKYARPGWKIFDPMFGSASSAIACHMDGFFYTGTERHKNHFEDAKKRLTCAVAQYEMEDLHSYPTEFNV